MIELRNVTKYYEKKMILNKVNLKIADGSIFGLVGIAGAGKSTLLRIMSGVIKATDGTVFYDENADAFNHPDIFFLSDDMNYGSYTSFRSLRKLYQTFYFFDKKLYAQLIADFNLDERAHMHECQYQ